MQESPTPSEGVFVVGSVLRAYHGLYGLYGLSGLVPQSGLSLSCPIVIRVLALAQGYRL